MALIIFFGAFLRLFRLGDSCFRPHHGWNEAHFASVAINLWKYGLFFQKPVEFTTYDFTNPPLCTWLMAIAIRATGNIEFGARIIPAIFGILSIPLLFYIGETLFNERVGLIASFLFAFNFGAVYFSRTAQLDVPMLFFILISFSFWIKYLIEKNITFAILSGVFLGVGCFIKLLAIIFGIVYFLSIFVHPKNFWNQIT